MCLRAAGLVESEERGRVCCDARQDEVWFRDPDGLHWEWYRVLVDSETFFEDAAP